MIAHNLLVVAAAAAVAVVVNGGVGGEDAIRKISVVIYIFE